MTTDPDGAAGADDQAEPRGWHDFLTARDRQVFAASGFGQAGTLGSRPAVLVIDMTNGFCGDRPEPILESTKRYRTSCGSEAWDALPFVNELTRAARAQGHPVLVTKGAPRRADGIGRGLWARKNNRQQNDPPDFDDLVSGLEIKESDVVVTKTKPSAFHGTPLLELLVELEVDSLVVCGATTSGCVRASVVDAFSYNYPVLVAEEATVDRGQASHWVGLFDMHMKYATVLPTRRAVAELERERP
jgi:maleamate amidohydrolase